MESHKKLFYQKQSIQLNEHFIIDWVRQEVFHGNKDNISRTKYYQKFFLANPEIAWAFLASMVSRNTGWNMGDLYGETIPKILDAKTRKRLFLTLERANWIIFKDAIPQLLIYKWSKKLKRPLFHLLDHFFVSGFMQKEWRKFWKNGDRKRLMYALIVNEQHMIHEPVILHPFYKEKIFHSAFFALHELLHFNCVVFPTVQGELYGESVVKFKKVWKRIELGKRLSSILFDVDLYPHFYNFALKTEPTGSRYDYERYTYSRNKRSTPFIRAVLPVIEHHSRKIEDWSLKYSLQSDWAEDPRMKKSVALTSWYFKKQEQLQRYYHVKQLITKRR
ncbi:YppC [Bacillus freudenreichii]|nr:YppC [Bacillus freudenreichii]